MRITYIITIYYIHAIYMFAFDIAWLICNMKFCQ